MIKVTAGPTVIRYAEVFGIEVKEVVNWINEYISTPTENREPTEEERRDSIFGYIKSEIESSTYGRIKESMKCSTTDANSAA